MSEIQVLQIGSQDLIGKRFNGQDVTRTLNDRGKSAHHLVWEKEGADPNTTLLFGWPGRRFIARFIERVENRLSIRCWLQIWTLALLRNKYFVKAKIVHLHILYWPSFMSILILPLITRRKSKTIWTIHDHWAFTGHCVYAFDCTRYQIGCGKCPALGTNFKMRRDRTRLNWKVKRFLYKRSNFEIIVATKYMEQMVRLSPILNDKPIHLVPFGLDLDQFSPGDTAAAKALFGIDPDTIVVAFRAAPGGFKGYENIVQTFRRLSTKKKVCLLVFGIPKQMEEFRDRYQIIDLGWIHDEKVIVSAYRAADLFLMPSSQESFGLMAIEAMACAKPVVVFSGTSLPEVINGDECGYVVPQGDDTALVKAVSNLIEDQELREKKGKAGRDYAVAHYDYNEYVARLERIYGV